MTTNIERTNKMKIGPGVVASGLILVLQGNDERDRVAWPEQLENLAAIIQEDYQNKGKPCTDETARALSRTAQKHLRSMDKLERLNAEEDIRQLCVRVAEKRGGYF